MILKIRKGKTVHEKARWVAGRQRSGVESAENIVQVKREEKVSYCSMTVYREPVTGRRITLKITCVCVAPRRGVYARAGVLERRRGRAEMDWYSDWPRTLVGLTLGAGCLLYYLLDAAKVPVVACRPGAWRGFLEQHLGILQERYWPTPWCYESRCQTIMASVLRARLPHINYRRELLELKDGGQVCLDWLNDGREHDETHPTVIILPGLTGSSQSEYVKSFVLSVQDAGARCVVFNNRGRGGVQLKTARTYCAANSDDLEEAIEHIHKKYPKTPLMATGISLGGMILGNYLVTRKERAAEHLVAAMVLSIPWNVFVGTQSLEKPLWNLMLNRHLASCLCESIRSMRKQLEGNYSWDLDHVMKSKTIREFDSRFTAVQFGFRDVEDYYRTACLHDKLHLVRVPLLCLSAADDPFQPLQGIPVEEAKKSSHVAIVVTSRGGHIGFMEGIIPTNTYYSDRLYKQLVSSVFSNLEQLGDVRNEAQKYATEVMCSSAGVSGDGEGSSSVAGVSGLAQASS